MFEVCCTAEIVIRDLITLHAGIPYPPGNVVVTMDSLFMWISLVQI